MSSSPSFTASDLRSHHQHDDSLSAFDADELILASSATDRDADDAVNAAEDEDAQFLRTLERIGTTTPGSSRDNYATTPMDDTQTPVTPADMKLMHYRNTSHDLILRPHARSGMQPKHQMSSQNDSVVVSEQQKFISQRFVASDADGHSTRDLTSSSSAALTASASVASSSSRPSRLTLFLSWSSLLIAVFSMSAVGPMFLYLEKRHVSPILAIVYRQTAQICFLIPPTLWEHWKLMRRKRKVDDTAEGNVDGGEERWWTKRVLDETEIAAMEDKALEERNVRQMHIPPDEESGLQLDREDDETILTRASSTTQLTSSDEPYQSVSTRIKVSQYDPAAITTSSSETKKIGSNPIWQMILISVNWSISVGTWVVALQFTSAARASLFSSLYPIFIISYLRLWKRIPVSLGEFIGVGVCVLGISSTEIISGFSPDMHTLAVEEAAAANSNTTTASSAPHPFFESLSPVQLQLIGDVTCIFASIFIAGNVLLSSTTRKVVPLFSFTLLTSLFVGIFLLIATCIFEGTSFSMNPQHGIFGWMTSSEMFVRILLFGFVVGMIGVLGFNYAVTYINPIVFSSVQLLDPGISGIMSAMFGVEGWPVTSTYIGVVVITCGIFIVVVYQTKRENAQAEEKMKKMAMVAASSSPGASSNQLPSSQQLSQKAKKTQQGKKYERVEMQEMKSPSMRKSPASATRVLSDEEQKGEA